MSRLLLHIVFSLSIILFYACGDRHDRTVVSTNKDSVDREAPFVEGNKKIMHWENEEMQLFIQRYKWNMQRTETGLYIQITEPGSGDFFKEEDPVLVQYKTFLLSGELIYQSEKNGEKAFRVDKSEEIPALHEAAKMLRPGGKARLVIPSYLAYGVAGDADKVNGRLPIAMIIEMNPDLKMQQTLPNTTN